ncbi:MAG TPA: FtsX-like permease family protein [Gemmatimonadales bacterium]|nr:FtsX-like permease family protein [Gemmatimonadales bacterium]
MQRDRPTGNAPAPPRSGEAARASASVSELLEIASLMALVIGAVGLYGVVSYMVSLRGREMAVRMALGAAPAALSRLVLAQAAAVAAFGIVLGIAAALLLTRSLASLLYGVVPGDPVTLLGAAALMAAVSAAASWLPARRAAR